LHCGNPEKAKTAGTSTRFLAIPDPSGKFASGSKPEKLNTSTCFPLFIQEPTLMSRALAIDRKCPCILRDLAASHRLANLKTLEPGVIQIQWLVIPCPTMRSTERL
jgi:hypothetical protein